VTRVERIGHAILAELDRHGAFLNDPASGLRSLSVIIKFIPSGEVQTEIVPPPIHWTPG